MIRHIAPLFVIALACFSTAALAQASQSHNRGACRADAERLCAGVEHGHGRIFDCLAAQKDKLGDDCRKMVESRGK
jgi:hypothetical protein